MRNRNISDCRGGTMAPQGAHAVHGVPLDRLTLAPAEAEDATHSSAREDSDRRQTMFPASSTARFREQARQGQHHVVALTDRSFPPKGVPKE